MLRNPEPSARAALVTELSELAADLDLSFKVLPPVSELLGGKVGCTRCCWGGLEAIGGRPTR